MLQPDNLWVEAWLSTTPLPAYKQKRLFDDTREAEKLLHFLAGLSPCQLALLLMPSLLHSAIATIMSRQGTVQYNTIYNEWRPLSIVSSKFIQCFKSYSTVTLLHTIFFQIAYCSHTPHTTHTPTPHALPHHTHYPHTPHPHTPHTPHTHIQRSNPSLL